jgi:hypothetical protein
MEDDEAKLAGSTQKPTSNKKQPDGRCITII